MADPIAVAAGTGDVQVRAKAGRLHGYSARESATVPAAATFILRDGTSTAGEQLVVVEIAANASDTRSFDDPIEFGTGLFLDRVAGETEVTVFVTGM